MNAVNHVVIAGADAVVWLAALALQRAFRHRNLQVTVLESAAGDELRGSHWTLPSQRGMHAMIGIEEADLLRATGATFKLATEYAGFQGEGSRFLHAHGDIGRDIGAAPFYKYLIRETLAGKPQNPEEFSLAAVAAKLGRFAPPMGDDSALTASFTYGYHLDAAAYVAYLRALARRLGIARIEGTAVGCDRADDGHVRALVLGDGRRVAGDFFVHTRDAPDDRAEWEDWSAWLPCDRMLQMSAPVAENPAPLTQIAAEEAGWTWRVPLIDAAAAGHVYCSAFLDDDAAAAQLAAIFPGIGGAQSARRFRNGRHRSFWKGNRVSLGAAAMHLEPLVGANLHFAQLGIATLIELFPFDPRSAVEGVEFDRIMTAHADALRDFTMAHYRAGHARDGRFWSAARTQTLPDTLAHKLDLYRANGRIDLRDHETFEELDWAWLLLGAREVPEALELQITSQLDAVKTETTNVLKMQIDRLAASMPRHIDYLRRHPTTRARVQG